MLTIRYASAPDQLQRAERKEAAEILQRGELTLWFHLDSPTPEELGFIEKELKIHHLTIEDIVKQNQRPKIEPYGDYVYLTIHHLVPNKNWEIETSELDLLMGRNWVVSVHYGPLPAIIEDSRLHERLVAALGHGTDFLLYTLVDLVVDGYFPVLDEIDDEIDKLEDRLLADARLEDMNTLLALKQSLVHIRRAVGPQREVFNQLTRHDSPLIRPENLVYFRDVYDHLIRITEEIDSLRDLLSGALEIHLASASNQLNRITKRLTAWGTILIVMTTIAGIYGMNFRYMPELEWRYGYLAILLVMGLISLGLYFYFKGKDYL